LFPADTRGLKPIHMEVCYWALLFMPLIILLYLYSLQIKGDSNKNKKKKQKCEGLQQIYQATSLLRSLEGKTRIVCGVSGARSVSQVADRPRFSLNSAQY
jgi:hypothetical protein